MQPKTWRFFHDKTITGATQTKRIPKVSPKGTARFLSTKNTPSNHRMQSPPGCDNNTFSFCHKPYTYVVHRHHKKKSTPIKPNAAQTSHFSFMTRSHDTHDNANEAECSSNVTLFFHDTCCDRGSMFGPKRFLNDLRHSLTQNRRK